MLLEVALTPADFTLDGRRHQLQGCQELQSLCEADRHKLRILRDEIYKVEAEISGGEGISSHYTNGSLL